MYIRIYTLRQIHSFTLSIMPSLDRIHSILFLCKVLPIISLYRSANESHYLPRPFSELFFLLFPRMPFLFIVSTQRGFKWWKQKKNTHSYTQREIERNEREKNDSFAFVMNSWLPSTSVGPIFQCGVGPVKGRNRIKIGEWSAVSRACNVNRSRNRF